MRKSTEHQLSLLTALSDSMHWEQLSPQVQREIIEQLARLMLSLIHHQPSLTGEVPHATKN